MAATAIAKHTVCGHMRTHTAGGETAADQGHGGVEARRAAGGERRLAHVEPKDDVLKRGESHPCRFALNDVRDGGAADAPNLKHFAAMSKRGSAA